jgi:hypothetical protein
MKTGDPVKFNHVNGSRGRIEAERSYGGFYVRWYYGRDVKGEHMTALSSVHEEDLVLITEEELTSYSEREGWGS